ncbi:MAG: PKD domain-containing protein [Planctomycetes bacterium]|nr:PKD domain-containing protein [Planctomycetota bacterium]
MRFLACLAPCLFVGAVVAQIPIPPHAAVYNGYSRGFNFTAQTPFVITGLDLPVDAFQAGDTAGYLVRVNGNVALWSVGNVGAIGASIPIAIGDVVDVIGNWSPAVTGNFSGHNSYGNTAPYSTTIHGVAHTLNRTGWQWDIGAPGWVSTGATGTYLAPVTGQIGRVIVQTAQSGLFANFTASATTGASPLTVNFTDLSFSSDPGGISSWAWDFDGDNVVDSTAQNPSFTYTGCGDFNVSLTVTDASNPTNSMTKSAYIRTDGIVADFTSGVIAPLTVQFTDTSNLPATSWAWDLDGDSIVDSNAPNPVWVYPNGNAVNVTLTVTRNCKSNAITKSVIALQQLTTNLAANNGVGTPATLYFNLDVLNPAGVTINSFDTITSTISTAFTADVYLKQGTYQGSELVAAPWTLVGTASGTTAPVANQPANSAFANPLYIPQGSYGVAIRYIGAYPRYVTQTALTTWATADLSLTAGAASLSTAGAFTGTNLNSPRSWSGTLYYGTHNLTGAAGHGFFGQGCSGSAGISHQQYVTPPQLGGTLSINCDNLPFAIGVMIVGTSNTISGFGPLPVDLGIVGAPGCPLRVSVDGTDTVVGVGTTATWNFPIPNVPALNGLLFYNQLAVLDPAANAFGLVIGDAAGWVLGL